MNYRPPQYNALCAPIDHLEPIDHALPEHASRSLKLTMQALAAVNHIV